MRPYFKPLQADILIYKNKLDKENVVIDKTNKIFLDLILNILDYLARDRKSVV